MEKTDHDRLSHSLNQPTPLAANRFLSVLLVSFGLWTSNALLFCTASDAAQRARVKGEEVDVYEGPGKSFDVLDTLPGETELTISNEPTSGFYKVRTPDGTIGWIRAKALSIGNAPDADSEDEDQPVRKKKATKRTSKKSKSTFGMNDDDEDESDDEDSASSSDRSSSSSKKSYYLKGFLGTAMFTMSDINNTFGMTSMANGIEFGGQLGIPISSRAHFLTRAEYITKTVSVNVQTASLSSMTFDLKTYTLPVQAGFGFILYRGTKFELNFDVLGGMALFTRLISTATDTSGNSDVATFSTTPITFSGQLSGTYYLSKGFGINGEAGYRSLAASTVNGDGNGAGNSAAFGSPPKTALSFSGLYLTVGGLVRF